MLLEEDDKEYTSPLAKNIQQYMEQAGKNQKEMAEIVGVSAPTMHDWLKGKKIPRMHKVQKMADYFGVTLSDLIEGDRDKSYEWIYNDPELLSTLDIYKKLPDVQKKAIISVINSFSTVMPDNNK